MLGKLHKQGSCGTKYFTSIWGFTLPLTCEVFIFDVEDGQGLWVSFPVLQNGPTITLRGMNESKVHVLEANMLQAVGPGQRSHSLPMHA